LLLRYLILGGVLSPLGLKLVQKQNEQPFELGQHLLGEEFRDVVLCHVFMDTPADEYPEAHQELRASERSISM
jgi:hypothetical protein